MKLNDDNLLQEIKAQNPQALEFIMNTYSSAVYWLAARILQDGSPEDIEECVSDVFVQAWSEFDHYEPQRGPFKTWLLILTKYKALDYRRKLKRDQPMTELSNAASQIYSNPVEEHLLSRESREQLLEAIKALKETDRQIFVRRYLLYQSIDDIAGSLGLTRQAVDNRLWRTRKTLQKLLVSSGKEVIRYG